MDIFKEYDNIVSKSLQGMMILTERDQAISLGHFDIKDKDHLYLFHIAQMCSELTNKSVIINTNIFSYIKLKLMFHKFKFKFGTGMFVNVNAPVFVKMLYDAQPPVGWIGLGDIYDAYYAPGKDKE